MPKAQSDKFRLQLVKPAFDVTLSVNDIEPVLAFWKARLGLVPQEILTIREGLTQYRHRVGNSILKMNHHVKPLPRDGATGYHELIITREGVRATESLIDPKGTRVTIEPAVTCAAENLGFRLLVSDIGASREFYGSELGLPLEEDQGGARVAFGESFLRLQEDNAARRDPSFDGPGWRYPTIQVPDVDVMHKQMVEREWRVGLAIKQFGTSVRFCFARDPDGNWIEFIQRS